MDDDLLPISALQHFVYCPRQFALIHLERLWADDAATMQGSILHHRVHEQGSISRPGVRVVTAMPLRSDAVGLIGEADRVEFCPSESGLNVRPVEFKRGRPKRHRADEVQLCAQAICLEEMLGCTVSTGSLFYGEPRRRTDVLFDDALRSLTIATANAARAVLDSGRTPSADYSARKCSRCSLLEACQPKTLANRRGISAWLQKELAQLCADS